MGQLANVIDGSVEVRELKQAGTTTQQLRNEGFSGIRTVELYEEGRRGIGTWDDQAADFEATVDIGAGGARPLGYRIWRPRSGHRARIS